MIVITITITVFKREADMFILDKCATISSAKVSAAKALARNPAKVIPIWIVARKLLGLSINFFTLIAFLFPCLYQGLTLFY